MKTIKQISLAFGLVFSLFSSSAASAEPRKIVTHGVRPSDDARVREAEPGATPSDAHPDGTVFALVLTGASGYVAELDLATGAVVHRSDIACSAIVRAGPRLFAACGKDTVAFDLALTVLWRVHADGCNDGAAQDYAYRIAYDDVSRLVTAYACNVGARLRVVDATAGRVLGEAQTTGQPSGGLRWKLDILFRPDAIVLVTRMIGAERSPAEAFLLRTTATSVARQVTRLGAIPPLNLAEPVYLPTVAGGQYIAYDFDHGPVHLWISRDCCGGGGIPAGLYAGRVDR